MNDNVQLGKCENSTVLKPYFVDGKEKNLPSAVWLVAFVEFHVMKLETVQGIV